MYLKGYKSVRRRYRVARHHDTKGSKRALNHYINFILSVEDMYMRGGNRLYMGVISKGTRRKCYIRYFSGELNCDEDEQVRFRMDIIGLNDLENTLDTEFSNRVKTKNKKKLLCVGLAVALCGLTIPTIQSDAYIGDKAIATDISTWGQSKWDRSSELLIPQSGSSSTIGGASCSYHAVAAILVKSGIEVADGSFTPLSLIDRVRELPRNIGWWDFGLIHPLAMPTLYEDLGLPMGSKSISVNMGGYSLDQAMSLLKKWYNDGYYLQVNINRIGNPTGHYVFIDGYTEDGRISLFDSGAKGTYWDEIYSKGKPNQVISIKNVNVYSIKDRPANKQQSLYNDGRSLVGVIDLTEFDKEFIEGNDSAMIDWSRFVEMYK